MATIFHIFDVPWLGMGIIRNVPSAKEILEFRKQMQKVFTNRNSWILEYLNSSAKDIKKKVIKPQVTASKNVTRRIQEAPCKCNLKTSQQRMCLNDWVNDYNLPNIFYQQNICKAGWQIVIGRIFIQVVKSELKDLNKQYRTLLTYKTFQATLPVTSDLFTTCHELWFWVSMEEDLEKLVNSFIPTKFWRKPLYGRTCYKFLSMLQKFF